MTVTALNPLKYPDDSHLTRRATLVDGIGVPVRHPAEAVGSLPVPQVSVVVVSFNAGEFLEDCVRAVLDSSIPVQLIVCDNASEDGSIERLENRYGDDERLLILRNASNLGFAGANNRAVKHAKARYVTILNPDCFVKPDTLEHLCQVMQSNPDTGMVGCMVRNPDGTEQAGTRRSLPSPWRSLVRSLHLDVLFPGLP